MVETKKEFLNNNFDILSIPSKSTMTRVFAIINPKRLVLSIVCILKSLINEKT